MDGAEKTKSERLELLVWRIDQLSIFCFREQLSLPTYTILFIDAEGGLKF